MSFLTVVFFKQPNTFTLHLNNTVYKVSNKVDVSNSIYETKVSLKYSYGYGRKFISLFPYKLTLKKRGNLYFGIPASIQSFEHRRARAIPYCSNQLRSTVPS